MRHLVSAFFCVVLFATLTFGKSKPKSLQIYFLDTEGGQATLVVTPSRQAVLFDTGWAGGRDAGRIVAAAKDAKVKRLDYVVITHFHDDHVGGVTDLAQRMKIGILLDHGQNQENSDAARSAYAAYEKVIAKTKHWTVKPGDGLPVKDVTMKVIAAAGEHIASPLPGAGTANLSCDPLATPPADESENSRSVGTLVTFGKFRFLDMGDLSQKQELEMACPNHMVGTIDLYLVTHHGADGSNAKAWVEGLAPRVAIMENGAAKGDDPATWKVIRNSPGLEDFWQLHRATSETARNVDEPFIANVDAKSEGNYLKVVARQDGSFTVWNSRTLETRSYKPGARN